MQKLILLSATITLLLSCSPKIHVKTATADDVVIQPRSTKENAVKSGCYDPLAYVEHPVLMRMKYVKLNIHFMNSSDGTYMMPESDVLQYAKDWVAATNSNLGNNMKMFLPRGNNTPVLPIPYRYVLTGDPNIPGDQGVYYHVDDTLCYAVKTGRDRNISDKRVIKKYAVNPDSVLNIFILTHQLDSIKSKTYKPDGSGISLGSSLKIFGRWFEKPSVWDYRGIFNHEVGHSLGLSHTWGGQDGCDDTPPHPNCWNVSDKPPCDSLYSNNMMDYNAHEAALTPCQIGKVLLNMSNLNSIQRNILQPRWCTLDTSATIIISDSVRWRGSSDLEGNVMVKRGGRLEINCRVSLPENATITVESGGTLVILPNGHLHNSCNSTWGGIRLVTIKKETGKIIVNEGGRIEDTPTPLVLK